MKLVTKSLEQAFYAATNPVADRPVGHREVVGERALGEEGWTRSFRLHALPVRRERRCSAGSTHTRPASGT